MTTEIAADKLTNILGLIFHNAGALVIFIRRFWIGKYMLRILYFLLLYQDISTTV